MPCFPDSCPDRCRHHEILQAHTQPPSTHPHTASPRLAADRLSASYVQSREVACGLDFRVQLCEFSIFCLVFPTQEGSMGVKTKAFVSLGQSRTSRGQAFDFVCHEFRVELCELGNFCLVPSTQEGSIGVENETFFSLGQSRTGGGQDHAPSWPDSCSWYDWRSMESVSRFSITQF